MLEDSAAPETNLRGRSFGRLCEIGAWLRSNGCCGDAYLLHMSSTVGEPNGSQDHEVSKNSGGNADVGRRISLRCAGESGARDVRRPGHRGASRCPHKCRLPWRRRPGGDARTAAAAVVMVVAGTAAAAVMLVAATTVVTRIVAAVTGITLRVWCRGRRTRRRRRAAIGAAAARTAGTTLTVRATIVEPHP